MTKASVVQGEKLSDTTVHEVSHPPRDGDCHPEQLRREIEAFVRQEWERSVE